MTNITTRTAIEAGYNFHTEPSEAMVSYGLVAKVAGWEVVVEEGELDGPDVIRTSIGHDDSSVAILIGDTSPFSTHILAHVYDNGELVGQSNNPAEIIWWILDNAPGAVYPLPK